MQQNMKQLQQMYRRAIDMRSPWINRWDTARRYTMPTTDEDNATLFDSTAADAVDNLAASMYSLITPPESLWMTLVPESDLSPNAEVATAAFRANLNDSNFYTTIHQCYMDLVVMGTACLFMSENPIGASSAFSFTAIPMYDIAILPNAVFHTTSMRATDVVARFPQWTPPADLRDKIKRDPEMPLKLVQSLVGTDFVAWLDVGGDIENNIVSTGTFETNPYIIASAANLKYLSAHYSDSDIAGKYFKQVVDIDLANHDWSPINSGWSGRDRVYHYDGGNHTIYNLYMNYTNITTDLYIGLFGIVGGDSYIKNLTLSAGSVNLSGSRWALAGAFLGDDHCINTIKKTKPDIYELYGDEWEEPLSLRDSFIQLIGEMDVHSKESFLQIVDAYSYKWHDRYVAEICKQLNIHKSYCDDGGDHTPRRRITVRKSKGGKHPYELVLTLANGKEVVINKINLNSLVLYLLTLICSYKSGYTTMMAKSESCRPLLKELARLVCGSHVQDFDDYVEAYMSYEKDEANKKNEDYYKKYSNDAKVALKKSLDVYDDTDCFLFNIHRVGKKILRRSNLDFQYIELPPELMELAINMPDAMDVIQGAEKQEDTSVAQE